VDAFTTHITQYCDVDVGDTSSNHLEFDSNTSRNFAASICCPVWLTKYNVSFSKEMLMLECQCTRPVRARKLCVENRRQSPCIRLLPSRIVIDFTTSVLRRKENCVWWSTAAALLTIHITVATYFLCSWFTFKNEMCTCIRP